MFKELVYMYISSRHIKWTVATSKCKDMKKFGKLCDSVQITLVNTLLIRVAQSPAPAFGFFKLNDSREAVGFPWGRKLYDGVIGDIRMFVSRATERISSFIT